MSTPDGGRLPADMKVFGQLPNNLTFHLENGEHSMVVPHFLDKKSNYSATAQTLSYRLEANPHLE